MAKYVVVSAVRQAAKARGKRVSKSFISWLDCKMDSIIEGEIASLGGRMTLSMEESSLRGNLNAIFKK
jgi:hypothetical protein